MKTILIACIALVLTIFSSCSKEGPSPNTLLPPELQKVGEQTRNNRKIIVWGDQAIETGYEKFYLQFLDTDGKNAPAVEVSAIPMMYMEMHGEKMSHSAPVDPVSKADNQLFETGVVFTMASDGSTGRWEISVIYVGNSQELINFDVPVQVNQSREKKVQTLTTANGDAYLLSLYQQKAPSIGVNPVSFTLHKRGPGKTYSPFSGAHIKVDPRMPDMDNHGSPNNVNPVHTHMGHYNGKLNYTMSGLWRLNVDVDINGEVIRTSFDQTF